MISRKIFKKKRSYNKKLIIITIFFSLLFIYLYLFIFNNKAQFILVPENNTKFYIIPNDKGGQKVSNLDKKSLNISPKLDENYEKIPNLKFSIQFYSNTNLLAVKKYLDKITLTNEKIYLSSDFYILSLNSEIGSDYFLLFKNFETRKSARDYCIAYLNKINDCLIVDTRQF
tara:strand:- start:1954 stop:2469 length:516 start_codon:yes stop_codon:yes gene_type:complete